MQQMTNILLSKTGNSAANSAKTSSQESNNEDFSSTLASVTASSFSISASKKTIANIDDTVQVTSADKVKDDDISTDDADVNLIFAQISMANDMKKTASDGDSLPLAFLNAEEDITGEENIDTSSALLTGSALASTVSAEIELASDIDEAGFSAELQKLVSTSPDMAAILIVDDVKPSSLTDKSLVQILPIDPNILEVSADSDAVIDPNLTDDASELPLEDTELVSATEVGVSIDESLVENEVTLNAVINQAGLANSATIKSATNTAAKATTSSSTVNSPNTANIATSGNTFDLNTLGSSTSSEPLDTTSVTESDLDGSPNSDLAANLLLKDAKLTVAMDIPRDESFMDDSNTFSELKSTSSIQTLSMSQLNRQETMQVQLSLRQGVEQQNQMQEMIQRFSPVMKQQLITMVSQGIQHAEIRLDPPELGHMLVKIQVHGDQTQVQFHVTQPQTRDLVEQAMPRLRELLQEQGMQLADSHVSQGDQGERREGSFGDGGSSNAADMDEISAEELHLGLNQAISVTSGIDYYA
ncbi:MULTISPECIES: flagellar hook-length control protein FliK [unclassified Shewanella]|uniref:flagellar hook-length control protein FliK n=1 Tax=unclassified Shewanella TaxID=196818 RepID=UPI0021D8DB21|nr:MULTISPECIES: flagellar hook-length control protein FliK [unclassified Shewanella]MCU8001503.1 flagellar hook-length control protein FliK [Shewanella sp. SM96]MCU8059888.1 flagellar hook-length control protein FliK [Shewanella sp. SM55]MCU8087240.1 flagellar hook-length control protein FliK [Shewanella sp. SM21]